MSIAKQIHVFLEVSETFLRQSGKGPLDDEWSSLEGVGRAQGARPLMAGVLLNRKIIRHRSAIMLANANFTDPWMQTLGLLSVLSGDTDAGGNEVAAAVARCGRKNCDLPVMGQRFQVQVHVIDRPSKSTATVIWRDPTRCSYGDQVWHASRARVTGVCAMSGRGIQPRDAPYGRCFVGGSSCPVG